MNGKTWIVARRLPPNDGGGWAVIPDAFTEAGAERRAEHVRRMFRGRVLAVDLDTLERHLPRHPDDDTDPDATSEAP